MSNCRSSEEVLGTQGLGIFQELMRQVREGDLTLFQLQAVVEHRNPFEVAATRVDLGKTLVQQPSSLLETLGSVASVACRYSVADILENKIKGVNIYVWESARMQLTPFGSDKVFEAGEEWLRYRRLNKRTVNWPILSELGELARIPFASMLELVVRQAKGQNGALLTNGRKNIYYPEESPDWAFYWCRRSLYRFWDLYAIPATGPYELRDDSRVFSH